MEASWDKMRLPRFHSLPGPACRELSDIYIKYTACCGGLSLASLRLIRHSDGDGTRPRQSES